MADCAIQAQFEIVERRYRADNIDQIVKGLDLIAQNLPTRAKEIKWIGWNFERISEQLRLIADRLASDDDDPKVREIKHDVSSLMLASGEVSDSILGFFRSFSDVDVDALWLDISARARKRTGIGLFEQVFLVRQFADCLVAILGGTEVNPRFLHLRRDMASLAPFHTLYIQATNRRPLEEWEKELLDGELQASTGAERSLSSSDDFEDSTATTSSSTQTSPSPPGVRLDLPTALPFPAAPQELSMTLDPPLPRTTIPYGYPTRPEKSHEPHERASNTESFPKVNYHDPDILGDFQDLQTSSQDGGVLPDFHKHCDAVSGRSPYATDQTQSAATERKNGARVCIGPVAKEDINAVLWSDDEHTVSVVLRGLADASQTLCDPHIRSRWWHAQRQTMSFLEFQAIAKDATSLENGERPEVLKFLKEVQCRNVKAEAGEVPILSTFSQNVAGHGQTSSTQRQTPVVSFISCCYFDRRNADWETLKHTENRHQNRNNLAELWILVIGESFILTYGNMSRCTLDQDIVLRKNADEPYLYRDVLDIEVRADAWRAWLVPGLKAPYQQTPFVSAVAAFGERLTDIGGCDPLATLVEGDSPVDVDIWHKHTFSLLSSTLCFPPLQLRPTHHNLAIPHEGSHRQDFHTSFQTRHNPRLRLLSAFQNDVDAKNESSAHDRPDRLHKLLAEHAQNPHASLYNNRLMARRSDVERGLEEKRAATPAAARFPLAINLDFEDQRLTIATMAMYMFDFFWLPTFHHNMADIFWGAVGVISDRDTTEKGNDFSPEIYNWTRLFSETLHRKVALPAMDLTYALAHTRLPATLASIFESAWCHILMAFVLLAGEVPQTACQHLQAAGRMLDRGNVALADHFRFVQVRSAEICPLLGVAALCINKVIHMPIADGKDTLAVHEEAFRSLDTRMTEEPLLRTHQDDILALTFGTQSAITTLESQLDIVNELIKTTRSATSSSEPNVHSGPGEQIAILLPLLGPPRLGPLLEDSRDHIRTNIDGLAIMCVQLTESSRSHETRMASNKDQQEAAIAAFTMITVIFLPLSWLTGVFGMNFADIRNLPYNNWLYWVIAVPFATILGVGAWRLVGADQLGYLRRRRIDSSNAAKLSAFRVPEPGRQPEHLSKPVDDTALLARQETLDSSAAPEEIATSRLRRLMARDRVQTTASTSEV